jgi:ABC-type transport system involved in multi-copper enzyme maturation permease subunit
MKPLLRASWILFQAHLWRIFRTRRGLIAVLLAGMPVVLAAAVRVVSHLEGDPLPMEPLIAFTWFLLVQTIVPLVALVMASAVVAEEIEDRTITYLFTRPIPRPAILLGRWLAVVLPIVVLLCASAELGVRLLAAARDTGDALPVMPAGLHGSILLTVLMGGVVYSALFASAGALFKRPMLIGLGYTFVYEGFLGNLPGANQKATVQYYLRSFLFSERRDLMGEVEQAIFSVPLAEPGAAVRALALILVGALVLAAWRFTRREYVLAA